MHCKMNVSEIVFYINSNKETNWLIAKTRKAAKTVLHLIHIHTDFISNIVEKVVYLDFMTKRQKFALCSKWYGNHVLGKAASYLWSVFFGCWVEQDMNWTFLAVIVTQTKQVSHVSQSAVQLNSFSSCLSGNDGKGILHVACFSWRDTRGCLENSTDKCC